MNRLKPAAAFAPAPVLSAQPGAPFEVLGEEVPQSQWKAPSPPMPTLGAQEVHVWSASVGEYSKLVPDFWAVLSHGEQARALSFKFPKDHDRFIIQCGLLRWLLSQYLPGHPADHEITRGVHGKPALVASPAVPSLYFNVSHSDALLLYAFSHTMDVGVDVEHIRPMNDLENIARNFFAAEEAATLHSLSPNQRLNAFFDCWTRKEAILKATGQGITGGVDGVVVNCAPGEPARLLSLWGDTAAAAGWVLTSLTPAIGYVAALAYIGPPLELCCYGIPSMNPGIEATP